MLCKVLSPPAIKRQIKEQTSIKTFEEFRTVKKKYWGRHFFWAHDDTCVVAEVLTKEMIEAYHAHHFERNPNDGFDIEQPAAKLAGQ